MCDRCELRPHHLWVSNTPSAPQTASGGEMKGCTPPQAAAVGCVKSYQESEDDEAGQGLSQKNKPSICLRLAVYQGAARRA